MIAVLVAFSLVFAAAPSNVSVQAASNPSTAPKRTSHAYRISGIVVDSISGAPVSRAQVSISSASGDGDPVTVDANDGSFSFDGVPPGQKYRLSAVAPGYVSQSYNAHEGFTTDIAVGEGLDSEHLVFRLPQQAVIYGTVTDEHGEPVRNAQVMLLHVMARSRTPSTQAVNRTDDLGEYRFAHLVPGKYFVAVQAAPWYAQTGFKYAQQTDASSSSISLDDGTSVRITRPVMPPPDPLLDVVYPVTFYPAATDPHDAAELAMSAGEKREADVQLAAVPSVHLLVTNLSVDSGASDLHSDQMHIVNFEIDESFFDTSMGRGAQSAQIAPGEYEVSGLPPEGAMLKITESGPEGSEKTIRATVGGSTIDASSASANPTISGQVLFQDHAAPAGPAQVLLMDDRNSDVSAHVEKDGTFSFESSQLHPGTYTVHVNVSRSQGEDYVQHISGTGAKIEGRQISIESGGGAQLTITVGHGIGKINGVAKLDGKPLGGAMILLIPESGQNLEDDHRMDESDSDGSFALGGIIPGKYLLMAIQDGWNLDWTNPQALQPYRERAQRLEITPGQELKLELDVEPLVAAQPTQ